MHSNTSTTHSFPSSGQQQEFIRNIESAALTHNSDASSSNPSNCYSNTAFVSPKSYTRWNPYNQDIYQTSYRRGSLPLKKRRVAMLKDDHPYPLSFHRVDGSGFRTIDSIFDHRKVELEDERLATQDQPSCGYYHLGHEFLKRNRMNTSPFDKMNTLTLIAAAAAANEAGRSSTYSLQPNTVSFTPSLSSFDRVDQMRKPNTSFASSERDDCYKGDSCESEDDDDDAYRVKESKELSTSTSVSRNGYAAAVACQNHLRKSSVEATLQECPSSCSSGQDKRFTGLSPHEIRCCATTTRGRPCAYAAVQSTKYCFLHADYDTNPPPRRIKSSNVEDREISASSSVSPAAMIHTEDDVSDDDDPHSSSPAPSIESKTDAASKIPASSVASFKKRRTNAKFAEKHAESLRPLLSMMATDQWFGQSVQIAVGPLEGRTGTVQKWGNGWITVLIEGVGFHNRRSFELYLDTGNKDSNIVETTKRVKKKKDKSLQDFEGQDRRLFRCVSRDVVSPSPPTASSVNVKKSRAVTPKPSYMVNSRIKKGESTPKQPRVNPTSSIEIPETPLPQCVSDGAETPIPSKSSLEGMSNVNTTLSLTTAKVTPFAEKTTTGTRTLTAKDRYNIDLRFPGHCDDGAKQGTGITSSNSALVFRPSMGERTRGRASSLGGSHHRSQSSDTAD